MASRLLTIADETARNSVASITGDVRAVEASAASNALWDRLYDLLDTLTPVSENPENMRLIRGSDSLSIRSTYVEPVAPDGTALSDYIFPLPPELTQLQVGYTNTIMRFTPQTLGTLCAGDATNYPANSPTVLFVGTPTGGACSLQTLYLDACTYTSEQLTSVLEWLVNYAPYIWSVYLLNNTTDALLNAEGIIARNTLRNRGCDVWGPLAPPYLEEFFLIPSDGIYPSTQPYAHPEGARGKLVGEAYVPAADGDTIIFFDGESWFNLAPYPATAPYPTYADGTTLWNGDTWTLR